MMGSSETVLYISPQQGDDPLLDARLIERGFQVQTASTAQAGVSAFGALRADAVLCVSQLPHLDGLWVLDQVRQVDADVPFIFLTRKASVQQAIQVLKAGASDYVPIPVSGDDLENAIRKAVAERKEAFRADESLFRQLAENINEVFWMREIETGKVLYCSPVFEKIYGQPPDLDASVEDYLKYVHPDDREQVRSEVADALKSLDGKEKEFRIVRPDGSVRWIRSRIFPIRNREGSVYRICGTNEDVTARKEAEGALHRTELKLFQAEKMASLGNLMAGIAHEINTPVGAICSMHNTLIRAAEKLNQALTDEAPEICAGSRAIQAALKVIGDANRVIATGTERVTDIVRSLRSFARMDEAELAQATLHEGLDNSLMLIDHDLKNRIEVVKDYGDIPPIACYPGKLNQVFLNILVNAAQAIEGKGQITLRTGARDDRVYVAIQDTGAGISEKNLDKIFDPGFTTKGVGAGTGLGLSICYQIMQDHRGTIQVESVVGEGTTFTVFLPMHLDDMLETDR